MANEIRPSPRILLEFRGKYSATPHPVAESWPDLTEYSPSLRAALASSPRRIGTKRHQVGTKRDQVQVPG